MNYSKSIEKTFNTVSALIMLLMVSVQTSGASEIHIKIFEKTETENHEILLGEVGDVRGDDKALVQKIKMIVIGSAPLPGKTKRIHNDDIWIRLKQSGIAVEKISLSIPKNAVITRMTIEISKEDVEKIILDFLNKKLPWDKNKVKIDVVKVVNQVTLPKGNITYKVVPPKNTEYLGTTPLSIDFSVNGQFYKKIWVTADIGVFTEVVVTKRPLGRYKLITEDDIHLKSMNLAKLPFGIITSREEVLGKRTKRAIESNVVLKPDFVELPPLVKRGDIVLIIAESDGLKVTTLGKVKEKGRKGQMVRVENINSNKRLYARVLDSSSVKVDF